MHPNHLPNLTIIIPVRNEEHFVERTIQYLLGQDYPAEKVEILVGVAPSEDRTREVVEEIAARDARVAIFDNPYRFSSGARTLGAQMASGEILIFVDGHVYIDNDQLFRNTVRLMDEKQVMILSRPQLLDTPENTFFQRAVSLARKSAIGHGLDSTIYSLEDRYVDPTSAGASYRREVFDRVGNFDPCFDACEDVEFNYRCARAGFRSFTSADVAVHYYPRPKLRALFLQMCRYGAGRFRLAQKHPATLSIGTLIPPLMIGGMPLLALFGLFFPPLLYIVLMLIGLSAATICISALAISVSDRWEYLPILLPIYLALHLGLGWGFLNEFWDWATHALNRSVARRNEQSA